MIKSVVVGVCVKIQSPGQRIGLVDGNGSHMCVLGVGTTTILKFTLAKTVQLNNMQHVPFIKNIVAAL